MYFLIGAIVSTIVLVIYSQSFPLLHYFAISGACSPHPFHPAKENQLGDPPVPRGWPRGARHAPPRPRAPPHLPRPRHHHRHLDVRQSLDIHCGRSDRGQGDQVHQVYARLLPLVDAMVRAMVVVVLIFISLSRAKKNVTVLSRYHVFGFLWITQFCIACQHLVIAGSVAGWYFSK